MDNAPYATFTMTFLEFRKICPDRVHNIFKNFGTGEEVELLEKVFNGIWDFNEISGETINQEILFLTNVYNQHFSYYREMLDNYKKEYDYATGNVKTTTFSRSGESDTQGISVDLPNKKVDPDDIYSYPDSGDKSHGSSSSEGTTTVVDSGAILQLKREYMEQIRNVYQEFSNMFSDCFLHIFF